MHMRLKVRRRCTPTGFIMWLCVCVYMLWVNHKLFSQHAAERSSCCIIVAGRNISSQNVSFKSCGLYIFLESSPSSYFQIGDSCCLLVIKQTLLVLFVAKTAVTPKPRLNEYIQIEQGAFFVNRIYYTVRAATVCFSWTFGWVFMCMMVNTVIIIIACSVVVYTPYKPSHCLSHILTHAVIHDGRCQPPGTLYMRYMLFDIL